MAIDLAFWGVLVFVLLVIGLVLTVREFNAQVNCSRGQSLSAIETGHARRQLVQSAGRQTACSPPASRQSWWTIRCASLRILSNRHVDAISVEVRLFPGKNTRMINFGTFVRLCCLG
jgi:hypothetical protein